jgi:hypothetical protein
MDFESRAMTVREADCRYAAFKRRYDAGEVSDEEFDKYSRVMNRASGAVVLTASGVRFLLALAWSS